MNISPDLLVDFYQNVIFSSDIIPSCNILYRSRDIINHLKKHTHARATTYVKYYKPKSILQLDAYALYLVTEKDLVPFKECINKGEEGLQYVILLTETYDINQIFPLRKQDSYVILSTSKDIIETIYDLLDAGQKLLSWDSYFTHGIFHEHDSDNLLKSLDIVLPWDYVFSDADGNILFATQGYRQSRGIYDGNRISSEITQDLFSRKEFHELSNEQDIFYFYTASTDSTSLCQNLIIHGRYIARLVMPLPDGMDHCPPGLEELFRFCLTKLKDLLSNRNLLPIKHNNDHMHQMCKSLLEGGEINQNRMEEILAEYKWSRQDTYSLSVLYFESAPGWDTNLYMIYSFLMLEIEKKWLNACTVHTDNKILLILNHSKDSYSNNYDDYLQKIAYFVRDNLCKAGIASVFYDFSKLAQAKKEAEIALKIGLENQPYLWYYLYEDYRLSYMLKQISSLDEVKYLSNPQIQVLMDYDQKHEGELTKTLKTYLECNMNMTNAAKKLFIHRTSFCRRMNHIQELTSLDFDNPDVVLDLLLSFRILATD